MAGRSLALVIALCSTLAVCAANAGATTIVPMSDRELATNARAIVEATVVDAEPVWSAERGAVFTYVTVDVERVLKGDVPPGLLVLRQLGGTTEAHATVIFGAPDLRPNLHALLFLNADADGALHVAHLGFGLFRIEPGAGGAPEVSRPSFGAAVSPVTGEPVTTRAPRDEFVGDLLATLAAAGDGAAPASARPEAPIQIVPPEFAAAGPHGDRPAFTFLGSGFRWFEPDTSQKVAMRMNGKGAPTPSGGLDELKAALGAWSSISGSRLDVTYGGRTSAKGIKTDGVAAVSYGDPLNQIDDLVNCQGIVAMSGLSGSPSERATIRGRSFARITEADLVVNNGIDCVVAQWPLLLREILTHEMGHCLGLGHSSENATEPDPVLRDATMYWIAHNDGRGASVREDDSAAIRFLYGTAAGPLALATDALPDALPNQVYSFEFEAVGGTSPYTWSLASGALPAGLALASNGKITGTPTGVGSSSFTARVTDAAGAVEQRTLALAVTSTPAPFIAAAEYLADKRKLRLTGRFLGVAASVTVNGVRVVPGQVIRYKAAKGRLLVSGSASALGLRGNGSDTVTVAIDGRASNAVSF